MTFPILETKRLILKNVSNEDTLALYSILSQKEVTHFYGMLPLKSVKQASQVIESMNRSYNEKRGIRWGIHFKDKEQLIGTIGLNLLSYPNRKTEIGYELHPEHWRKGIITEAANAVISYCFDELQLLRIGAVTYENNKASQSLLTNLGFQFEGKLANYFYVGETSANAHLYAKIKK
ncbi:GNAT family acetyltransferase [Bacillus sp. JCM 19046]|nr:GNAT family acetyltransferase [Bacillus sp. JCM 19045]GAF19179.1 GNAT family acetyltransferase [Bacillus sp. JCM 19046]